jgi:hypothetical protein
MREQVLSALFGQLRTIPLAVVKRNEALPLAVPSAGLIIVRDGDPGEPDITLNPVQMFYCHRTEIEAFVSPPAGGGGEALLDVLLGEIGAALAADSSLGGLVENLFWSAPEISVLAIEGAAPILCARVIVTLEYLTADTLAV